MKLRARKTFDVCEAVHKQLNASTRSQQPQLG
jgi:hypothetical protein